MPSANRSFGRNVFIYNANDPETVLGGLVLTNGVTNANFYSMVEVLFIVSGDYFLRLGDESGVVVQRDDGPLQLGNYYICTSGTFLLLPLYR